MKGGWLWTWKDSIDRTFMAKFGADLDFEAMQHKVPRASSSAAGALQQGLTAEELALMAAAKMRCGGCGSKVGATTLERVLQRLRAEGLAGSLQSSGSNGISGNGTQQQAGSVVLGLDQPDDAAVLEPPPPGHVTVSRNVLVLGPTAVAVCAISANLCAWRTAAAAVRSFCMH